MCHSPDSKRTITESKTGSLGLVSEMILIAERRNTNDLITWLLINILCNCRFKNCRNFQVLNSNKGLGLGIS